MVTMPVASPVRWSSVVSVVVVGIVVVWYSVAMVSFISTSVVVITRSVGISGVVDWGDLCLSIVSSVSITIITVITVTIIVAIVMAIIIITMVFNVMF